MALGIGPHGFVEVQRRHWNGSDWSTIVTSGIPPSAGGEEEFSGIDLGLTGENLLGDATPALLVTKIDSASDPIVYLAFEVSVGGQRQLQIVAANGTNLGNWTSPNTVPLPPNALISFHPTLSGDGKSNILDLLAYDLEGPAAGPLDQMTINTYFYRFDASRFAVTSNGHVPIVLGPTKLNQAAPSLLDLPARHNFLQASLYAGEYVGLATKGATAVAGFPDLSQSPGAANVDLAIAALSDSNICSSATTASGPDSLWECSCSCGGTVSVVGCATASATTTAAACAQICVGSVCGTALTCTPMPCSLGTDGRQISAQSCTVTSPSLFGAPPASLGDFTGSATSASTAVFHVAGQTTTSVLGGQVFVNASTSPPVAGSSLEIARLNAAPSNVFIGGPVGATVQNIKVAHLGRIRGVFTDATHFTIAPGVAEFLVTVQVGNGVPDPDNPDSGIPLSAPTTIVAANPTPLTGTLDLAGGTISLDGTAGDAAGDTMELHFRSTITSRPPDTNHNGIIDAVDKCPGETVGPDRTPPVFTFVPPAVTTTSCVGVSLGQALASDPCGVTVTNDAPAKFPLGLSLVHWKARDGAGNVAVVAQQVTALLGDSTSCCPAGTHVIVGTSNNDVLNGTAGSDCILGLGGQDTINGGGGNDYISGGDGDDVISGGDGDDWLFGGSGQDTISGGAGADKIYGGDGVDQLNGDDGDDTISGGQGGDVIHGGTGNDKLSGDDDDDQIYGDDGNDALVGGAGNDHLYGGTGNDHLAGGDGDDYLDGGTGFDVLDGGSGHNQCIDNNMTILCVAEHE